MSLAQLSADVITLTKRPDLTAETTLAVKMATLKAHNSDYYPRDLREANVALAGLASNFTLATSSMARFRSLSFAQKSEAVRVATTIYREFDIVSPNELFDEYFQYRQDTLYLSATDAGGLLVGRSSTEIDYLYLGWYANPNITDGGFSSWIDDVAPYAIVTEATRQIFKTIGYDEQASYYDRLVQEQLVLLRQNYLLAKGY